MKTTWNVLGLAVELIEAESAEAAQAIMDDRLRAAGFEVHTVTEDSIDPRPFESEAL